MSKSTRAPIKVFVSYSHSDTALWRELKTHLGVLCKAGLIEIWWDREIKPGQDWSKEIADKLEAAELVLCLASAAFLDSDYCNGIELTRALERRDAGTAEVAWVLLSDCHYGPSALSKLQGLPTDLTPVDDGSNSKRKRNKVWKTVVEALDGMVQELIDKLPPPPQPGLIHNLPPSNKAFTGREELLTRIRDALQGDRSAVVTQVEKTAIAGLGGIGKTQAAIEYCHRHAGEYRLIWWVNADSPATLIESFQALAIRLGLPEAGAQNPQDMVAALKRRLEAEAGWLLVFDNADDHAVVTGYLPRQGAGSVLITSRDRGWSRRVGTLLDLDSWTREEAVAYLRKRLERDDDRYGELAEALGDLPLAIEQAAAFMEDKALDAAGYLALSEKTKERLLQEAEAPDSHEDGVWVTWQVSVDAAEARHAAARDLLNVLAFLAPDDIPRTLFTDYPQKLPERLRAAAEDGLGIQDAIAALARFSLIKAEPDALSVHRLVQTVTRARLADPEPWAGAAVAVLAAAFPAGDPPANDVRAWPACLRLRPHAETALALADGLGAGADTAAAEPTSLLLNQLALYQKSRAEHAAAKPLYERAIALDEARLGPDDPEVAIRVNNLGRVLQGQGDLDGAGACCERALAIFEARLGPDHPNTQIARRKLAVLQQ